ncbi:MAG TPA: hypothetical protein VH413_11465 [Verrucomicrobiae bacterium]|jgi:hypothetical protein|nr:hypothetical protein [Verrucomicrobiae bacterium]
MKAKSFIYSLLCFITLLLLPISAWNVNAQCDATFESKTAETNLDKCGYVLVNPDGNGINHFYLKEKIQVNASENHPEDSNGYETTATEDSTVNLSQAPPDCVETIGTPTGTYNEYDQGCFVFHGTITGSPVSWSGLVTWAISDTDQNGDVSTNLYSKDWGAFFGAEAGSTLTVTTTMTSQITSQTYSNGSTNDTDTTTITLSSEYTDKDLAGYIDGKIVLPAYDSTWGNSSSAGTASYSLDSTHTHGGGSKLEYRLSVSNSLPNHTYHFKWKEVTRDTNNKILSSPTIKGSVEGTGDPKNAALGDIKNAPVPSQPGTVTEESIMADEQADGNGGQ